MDEVLLEAADWEAPLELVVYEGMRVVPPGRAFRQAEKERSRPRPSKTSVMTGLPHEPPTERKVHRSQEWLIQKGARQVVMDVIGGAIQRGSYVKFERNGTVWLRLSKEPAWRREEGNADQA